MPKKGHTEEQIVAVLRQVEAGARVEWHRRTRQRRNAVRRAQKGDKARRT